MAKKEKHERELLYIKAQTIEDVARLVCTFGNTPRDVFMAKVDGRDSAIALGESLGDVAIAYYANVDNVNGDMLAYNVESNKAEFTSKAEVLPNRYYIDAIGIDFSGIKADGIEKSKVALVRLKSIKDLVKLMIAKSVEDEEIKHIYAFAYKGNMVYGAFDIIDQLANDKKNFYYVLSEGSTVNAFARYDYSKNEIDFSDSFGEHTFLYVKIINLAEPFPFFKPE